MLPSAYRLPRCGWSRRCANALWPPKSLVMANLLGMSSYDESTKSGGKDRLGQLTLDLAYGTNERIARFRSNIERNLSVHRVPRLV